MFFCVPRKLPFQQWRAQFFYLDSQCAILLAIKYDNFESHFFLSLQGQTLDAGHLFGPKGHTNLGHFHDGDLVWSRDIRSGGFSQVRLLEGKFYHPLGYSIVNTRQCLYII